MLSLRSLALGEAEVEDGVGRGGDEEFDGGRGRGGGGGGVVQRVEFPEAGHGAGEVLGIDCFSDAVGECLVRWRGRIEIPRGRR